MPGTQPLELTADLRPPSVCAPCHGGFGDDAPNDAWGGSMMANASRDPVFHAALAVAKQDEPDAPDLCIRCHSPRAWLFGRSEPGDLARFEVEDFESVQCDFCHRLVPAEGGLLRIGTGQYTVADDFVRRGPIPDPVAPHETELSAYHEQSELCGLCHDVSNPLQNGFAIERTYSEWLASAFPAEGANCQSCHLPDATGPACGARGVPERTVHVHELVGGNVWVPLAIASEHPELDRQASYERTSAAAAEQLGRAASLRIEGGESTVAGDPLPLTVRVENLTGHKLPTGYPEGRRMWLELEARDASGRTLLHSGAYDASDARLVRDPQLRAYEVRMAAAGAEGFHFILQDELLEDGRIPPRGFLPAPDTTPVGREYPVQPDGTLAHWDDAPFVIDTRDAAPGPLSVRATLWYQTTTREYVTFLRAANHTDDAGERLASLWDRFGRSAPVAMTSAEATIAVLPRRTSTRGGGCAIADAGDGNAGAFPLLVALGLLTRLRRRR